MEYENLPRAGATDACIVMASIAMAVAAGATDAYTIVASIVVAIAAGATDGTELTAAPSECSIVAMCCTSSNYCLRECCLFTSTQDSIQVPIC